MVERTMQIGKECTNVEFALPAWDEENADWCQIDRRIPDDHLTRRIDEGVNRLHLKALFRSYQGRGSPPLRADLMLKIVMYEIAVGRPSPAEWFRDTRDSDTVSRLENEELLDELRERMKTEEAKSLPSYWLTTCWPCPKRRAARKRTSGPSERWRKSREKGGLSLKGPVWKTRALEGDPGSQA